MRLDGPERGRGAEVGSSGAAPRTTRSRSRCTQTLLPVQWRTAPGARAEVQVALRARHEVCREHAEGGSRSRRSPEGTTRKREEGAKVGVVDHARYRPPVDTYACGYIPGTMPAAWPPPWLWIDTGVTRQLPRGPWQRGAREIIRAEVVPSQARTRPDHQDGSQARQGTACARPIRPTPLAKRDVLCTAPCSTPAGWRPSNTAKCGPFPSSALIPPPASPTQKNTRALHRRGDAVRAGQATGRGGGG